MNTVWQEQLDKAGANPRDDYLISSSGLAAQLGEAGVKVLDATTHLRPTEDGGFSSEPGFDDFLSEHIPGAQFADLQGALSDAESSFRFTVPSADQFARSVGALGITAGDEVVIYSSTHPMWATRMWWLFRLFGHQTVKLLDGGLSAWKAAGLAVEAGESRKVAAEYGQPVRQDHWFVDGEAILSRQVAGGLCLINALSAQQHRGEGPHYGRPGHITGSESLPWGSFLNEDLSFKSSDELKAHFDAVGAFDQNEIITYCGGGIAATVPIFSLALLGIEEGVALYDRSLSEWAQQGDWPMTQLASR